MGSKSKRTSSSHTTESETGTHSFKIVGYTLKVGIGVGKFIQSGTFTVGGYDWAIRLYPDGVFERAKEYVGIFLMLVSKKSGVRASFYELILVNQTTGLPETVFTDTRIRVFNSGDPSCFSKTFLIARNRLESKSAGYIRDNCLTIECTVTVIKESQVSETTGNLVIEVPPSDILEHFRKLFLEEEGADITFSVGGDTFPAHKIVLAARSPVLKAQLYGQMKESMAQSLIVEDIQPDVFKALLQFIYTDSLPEWDDLDAKDYCEIFRHLLAAADRYAMDRLKLLCASNLVNYLDVENVATTLALADQHNCDRLKDVCIDFMASSNEMKAVVETEGYVNLKRMCPSILVEVLEKTSRHRRI